MLRGAAENGCFCRSLCSIDPIEMLDRCFCNIGMGVYKSDGQSGNSCIFTFLQLFWKNNSPWQQQLTSALPLYILYIPSQSSIFLRAAFFC